MNCTGGIECELKPALLLWQYISNSLYLSQKLNFRAGIFIRLFSLKNTCRQRPVYFKECDDIHIGSYSFDCHFKKIPRYYLKWISFLQISKDLRTKALLSLDSHGVDWEIPILFSSYQGNYHVINLKLYYLSPTWLPYIFYMFLYIAIQLSNTT